MSPDIPWVAAGAGPLLVLVPGFALGPRTYRRVQQLLSRRWRVLVPDPFGARGRWRTEPVMAALERRVDTEADGPCTVVGHSFGGGLALVLGARRPDLVGRLLFLDSIALSRGWGLAANALRGANLLRLASMPAAVDFSATLFTRPARFATAGWWAFQSPKDEEMEVIRRSHMESHVLWAERDTLVSREDGQQFSAGIGASFDVVVDPEGKGPVDHDWPFRHPHLLERELERLTAAAGEAARG